MKDRIRRPDVLLMRVPEGEEKQCVTGIFEEMTAGNFFKHIKHQSTDSRSPKMISEKKFIHHSETTDKSLINKHITFKEIAHRLMANFSIAKREA